jgi:hypothetical protein
MRAVAHAAADCATVGLVSQNEAQLDSHRRLLAALDAL